MRTGILCAAARRARKLWLGGIPKAAASIFFAYIGFDAVSTAAQEAKNPKRDMPIGILGSLVVCTILYILVSLVLTGLVSYKTLNVSAPVALAIDATGVGWGSLLVKIGAVFGLATVMLVMLLGQTRVFYSMSKDGLLPKWASAVHPKFRTPWITTIVFGSFAAIMPAFFHIEVLSELVNIGTLLAFTIVSAGVWVLRVRHPHMERPFKTPFVPLVPILGIRLRGVPDDAPDADYMGSDDRLAGDRAGDLFRLFDEAQQGAGRCRRRKRAGRLNSQIAAQTATASRRGRPLLFVPKLCCELCGGLCAELVEGANQFAGDLLRRGLLDHEALHQVDQLAVAQNGDRRRVGGLPSK